MFDEGWKQPELLVERAKVSCVRIGMCLKPNSLSARVPVHRLVAALGRVGDIKCDECMFVFTELRDIMNENGTMEYVKNMLESLCDYLGGYKQEVIMMTHNNHELLCASVRRDHPRLLPGAVARSALPAKQSERPLRQHRHVSKCSPSSDATQVHDVLSGKEGHYV